MRNLTFILLVLLLCVSACAERDLGAGGGFYKTINDEETQSQLFLAGLTQKRTVGSTRKRILVAMVGVDLSYWNARGFRNEASKISRWSNESITQIFEGGVDKSIIKRELNSDSQSMLLTLVISNDKNRDLIYIEGIDSPFQTGQAIRLVYDNNGLRVDSKRPIRRDTVVDTSKDAKYGAKHWMDVFPKEPPTPTDG